MMLTVVCDTPGGLRAEQRERPVPREGDVPVRVKRVGVCGTVPQDFASLLDPAAGVVKAIVEC